MKTCAFMGAMLIAMAAWAYSAGYDMKPICIAERFGLVQEIYPANPEIKDQEAIRFRPVGVFHSPYNPKTGAPRQGVMAPETSATIEVGNIYRKGLAGLENFEHIIVLYYFNMSKTWSSTVKPPMSRHHFGLFATRSPRRPNPIGLSVVKLDSVDMEKGILQVSGIDAFDGTPVLDIKPYIPSVDIVQGQKKCRIEDKLGLHNYRYHKKGIK